MSSKSDNPENSGQDQTDKNPENKAENIFDRSQISMNFGQDEEANSMTEEEFQAMAEAEMKNRAQEGQRLREEIEVRKRLAQEQQVLREAEEKAVEEQRLQKEVKALEHRINEEADAQENTEVDREKNLEAEKRSQEDKYLEEVRAKREIEEKSKRKKAAALKARDEEWRKFKEETDFRGNQETADHKELTTENQESFGEAARTKTTSPKRKALLVLFMGVLAIAGLWIFSEFNSGAENDTPFYRNNGETDIEDTNVTPASDATEPPAGTEDNGLSPEIEDKPVTGAGTQGNADINDTRDTSSSEVENLESLSSDAAVGSSFADGIVFEIDSSANTGTLAYATDLEPMTWENAMKINEQLGEGWRLPTMEELSEMFITIGPRSNNSGQFTDELYWSDEAYDENQARLVRFSDGDTSFHYNKSAEHRKFNVRAVKDFDRE